jgi:hypothetical protein
MKLGSFSTGGRRIFFDDFTKINLSTILWEKRICMGFMYRELFLRDKENGFDVEPKEVVLVW